MYRRERAVMLEPRDRGIVLWTLRYGDEVRDPKDYFGDVKPAKVDSKALSLVETLIEERSKSWSPDMVDDPVQKRLLDLIASKKKGRKRPAKPKAEPAPQTGNVVNIMDALRKSLASEAKNPKAR
jgi:DNA end-binding protein Ku